MCICRLFFIRQFHIIELSSSYHLFLLFYRKRIPSIHIVNILLYKYITSTRKIRIFFTNYGKVIRILVHGWRFCSIYEANDCFTIHIPETVSFINSFDSPL